MSSIDILFFITGILGFSNTLYYIGFALVEWNNKSNNIDSIPIPVQASLIVCARNELSNLQKNLPYWLCQKDINLEVIIVDDASTDGSDAWLKSQAEKYPSIKIIHITDKEHNGKKHALDLGIRNARYAHLLLTDADCTPSSVQWAKNMTIQLQHNFDLILGFSPLTPQKSWVSRLAAFESVLTAMQYGSYCAFGIPYMGVGRNMAYTRALYEKLDGFSQHAHIVSGDDDLFVQQALANYPDIRIGLNRNDQTLSSAPDTIQNYLRQKSRHISTSPEYAFLPKMLLGWFALSHILYLLSLIIGICLGYYWIMGALVIIRIFSIGFAWRRWCKILLPGMNWKYYVCFDFWLPVYYLILASSFLRPTKTW